MKTSDTIILSLQTVRLFAPHGAYEEERTHGNNFEIDLHIELPLPKGATTDVLEDTINYASVAECITTVSDQKQYYLLEAFAYDICKKVLNDYPSILSVEIEIRKLDPPIPVTMKSVAVRFSAWR